VVEPATPSPERLRIYYGTDQPPAQVRQLVAGKLTAELVDGNLRAIRYGGVEVLRALAYLVRDQDWGTYTPALADLDIAADGASFTVRYGASCRGRAGERLDYAARIIGDSNGSLRFAVEATPEADFLTARCGFCVLHPIVGLAGTPVDVLHVDGSVEHATLPDLIDPWQPFKDIRAITHVVRPGLRATCRMEGDAFEMEDQRNWSDASFKTYVRPLALPWPYVLPAGVTQRQSVTLTLAGDAAAPEAGEADDGVVLVDVGAPVGTMPKFGLLLTPEETASVLAQRARLAEVAPQVLLCHFDPTAGHGLAALEGYAAVAREHRAEAVLECVLPCRGDPAAELRDIAALVRRSGLSLSAWAVSPDVDRRSTPPGSAWPACPPLQEVYAAARRAWPDLSLGGGSFSYFTELNRKRPPLGNLDFVTHATCPIVHSADDIAVMQTVEALAFITRSTRAFIGDTPYRIGPSTIGMRYNPYGARTMDNADGGRVAMAAFDPRQRGLFGAAWMIGYAASVVAAGPEVLTLAALTGPRGLVAEAAGAVHPAFHAARWLASLAGAPLLASGSSRASAVRALAVRPADGATVVALANLTDRPQSVRVRLAGGPAQWRLCAVDETTRAEAAAGEVGETRADATAGITLQPFGVVRLTEVA
jgi:hypothetical protein